MDKSNETTIECFVIFCKSKHKHWIMKYLDDKISHVYVMIKSKGGQFWQIINPAVSHLDISMELVDDYPHPRLYAGNNAVIVPIKSVIVNELGFNVRPMSCVELVKAILGIKAFWIFTPFQLYKYITGRRKEG